MKIERLSMTDVSRYKKMHQISAAERGVGSGLCIWKKLGDISVGSWKVFKKGTKHPALKYAGAMKMHSHRICFCSVSKSLSVNPWASQLPLGF